MLTHKHLKKLEFKNRTALPYRSKAIQKIFFKVKTPKLSLDGTQSQKKSDAGF